MIDRRSVLLASGAALAGLSLPRSLRAADTVGTLRVA